MAKFVDTNIFVEIFARKGQKSDRSLALLESSNALWTTVLAFAEIEWVLRDWYKTPKAKVIKALKGVLEYPNLAIENKKLLIESVLLYEHENIDWTDCYNLVCLRAEDQKEIYSYDKHFEKIAGIKRLEP